MARAAREQTLYAALEALSEGMTGEILQGQLHTEPRPATRHLLAAFNLGGELRNPYCRGRGGPGGWWILAAFGATDEVAVAPFEAASFRLTNLT